MKLIRFGDIDSEKPGVLLPSGVMIDASAVVDDYDGDFFENDGLQKLEVWLKENQHSAPAAPQGVRLGPPVTRPGKIICIGLNYSDHAAESGMEAPKEPVLFFKSPTALSGPYDDVELPRHSQKMDWEVELAFVIGKKAKYVEEAAERHIAGYAIMNDLSEREHQLERCGQWVKGKSHDTFAPLGPFLATAEEIEDASNLQMTLDVNQQRRQTGSTKTMIFPPAFLVHYISQFMTLAAGDIITTGTPPGVGLGMKPPVYLREGDVMELRIEGLGMQKQTVVSSQ
ncbi:MAG: fumarylacetoacetate hydrolase family protein [Candidatus Omnitrophica bacterium]|nr:fumarylacetoacetate hydrolase family protein [Candidatus Omnitrophota bacterium]